MPYKRLSFAEHFLFPDFRCFEENGLLQSPHRILTISSRFAVVRPELLRLI
jgi:hypothetical protein